MGRDQEQIETCIVLDRTDIGDKIQIDQELAAEMAILFGEKPIKAVIHQQVADPATGKKVIGMGPGPGELFAAKVPGDARIPGEPAPVGVDGDDGILVKHKELSLTDEALRTVPFRRGQQVQGSIVIEKAVAVDQVQPVGIGNKKIPRPGKKPPKNGLSPK